VTIAHHVAMMTLGRHCGEVTRAQSCVPALVCELPRHWKIERHKPNRHQNGSMLMPFEQVYRTLRGEKLREFCGTTR
jgi:hypothetical protein